MWSLIVWPYEDSNLSITYVFLILSFSRGQPEGSRRLRTHQQSKKTLKLLSFTNVIVLYVPILSEMAVLSAASDNIAAKRGAFHEIPVIDFADAFSEDIEKRKVLARKIYEACVRVGFFYIRNHRVDESIMEGVFSAAKDFFNLPLDEKMEIDLNKSPHFRGYTKLMVGPKAREQADVNRARRSTQDPGGTFTKHSISVFPARRFTRQISNERLKTSMSGLRGWENLSKAPSWTITVR